MAITGDPEFDSWLAGGDSRQVRHRDVDEVDDQPPVSGMTVLWRDGLPVGHLLRDSRGEVRREGAALDGKAAPFPAESSGDGISVVICTRDRPDDLARCLASLARQTQAPAEIIVVDNGSSGDETRRVAASADVIYVREDRLGLDVARNTGARTAREALLAYTDDDVVLHPRWLEAVSAAFRDDRISAVTGLVLPAELVSDAQLQFETFWSFARGYRERDIGPEQFGASDCFPAWELGAGANMAFRRSLFEQIGFFDERLDVGQAGCSGDSEYWYRILWSGGTIRYAPYMSAFHYHRSSLEGLSSQIYHYMRGHSAALLVQWERTKRRGNLRRAFLSMPAWFGRRLLRRSRPRDLFLRQEIGGFVSGLAFYLRHRNVD